MKPIAADWNGKVAIGILMVGLGIAAWGGAKYVRHMLRPVEAKSLSRTRVVDDQHLPEVVATVDGAPIKKAALVSEVDAVEKALKTPGKLLPQGFHDKLYRDALDELIQTELFAQEAERRHLEVTDKEIDEQMAAGKAHFASPEEYQHQLAAHGFDDQSMRADLKRRELAHKLLLADPSTQGPTFVAELKKKAQIHISI